MVRNLKPNRAAAFVVATAAICFAGTVVAQPAAIRAAIQDIPPFGGAPASGYCSDLLNAIAERMGLTLEFQPMLIGTLVPTVLGGGADVACSGLGPSSMSRNAAVAYTSAIATNEETLVVPDANTTAYTSLTELSNMRVGMIAPYVPLAQNAGITNITVYADLPTGIAALRTGEIDAYLTATTVFRYHRDVLGGTGGVHEVDSYVHRSPNYPALVTRAEDAELLGQLQAGLEMLKADGTLATLLNQWGLPAPPY